jgi:hypothetical protein
MAVLRPLLLQPESSPISTIQLIFAKFPFFIDDFPPFTFTTKRIFAVANYTKV